MYFGLEEGEFKNQRYYNPTQSLRNENYLNRTTLFIYVWKMKETKKETSTLLWEIVQTATPYTKITK